MDGLALGKIRAALVVALLLATATANEVRADENHFEANGAKISLNGWKVSNGGPDGTIALYRSPITVTAQGYRRMCERWEYSTAQTDVGPAYRTDLQYIENDCKARRIRSLQRNTFVGADMTGPPGWSSERGSDWQYVPPGSLADGLMDIACSGHPAPNRTTIVLPDAPHLSPEVVHTAVASYVRVQTQSGAIGAVAFIKECFGKLPRPPRWSNVDFCIAFDAAAGMLDASFSEAAKIPPTEFLSRQNRLQRAFEVISKMNPDKSVYANRINTLDEIVPGELNKAF